jgi:hypothetical protein
MVGPLYIYIYSQKKKRNIQHFFFKYEFSQTFAWLRNENIIMLTFKCPIIEFKLLIVTVDHTWPFQVSMWNAARGRRTGTGISRAVARANHDLSLSKLTSSVPWLVPRIKEQINTNLSQALEFRNPLFPHLVPPAIMVWIFVWKYIFEPFIHILQHFVLQLSRSTNFCF